MTAIEQTEAMRAAAREIAEKIVADARMRLICLKPEYDTVDLGESLILAAMRSVEPSSAPQEPDDALVKRFVDEIESYGEGLVPELRIVCTWLANYFRDPENRARLQPTAQEPVADDDALMQAGEEAYRQGYDDGAEDALSGNISGVNIAEGWDACRDQFATRLQAKAPETGEE